MPNSSSRSTFTGAVLLLLVAGLQVWVAYTGAVMTVGTFEVPAMMSWVSAGVFGFIGLLMMRAAHV